ncbi:beta-1,4-glucuronyltransferase 1-like [Haliotis rubra]|uniref:beta-1,4-glucuronyltransferase 1-like n=1 Tax=Haliotis rubra TaxID=36100 RepID=UPI001EE62271|nr:beta-1,4-glucuronyltransferase 1-like [Haliotis rubra]
MAMFAMFQRSRLGKFIIFLVFLVIVLQVFHMSLLTRLEAKEALNRHKGPVDRQLNVKTLPEISDDMEEKVRNSHRLDYSGTYHLIANLLTAEGHGSGQNTDDLAIATQCSSNHLHHLSHLSQVWDGPISVTVFTFDNDIETALNHIVKLYSCREQIRKKTSFHLVYPLERAPRSLSVSWKSVNSCEEGMPVSGEKAPNYAIEGIEYPQNLLRNLAIKNSETSMVFMVDIDMIPSENLHGDFLYLWRTALKARANETKGTAFVVPVFEVKEGVKVPDTKPELVGALERAEVRPFYIDPCSPCQAFSKYPKWLSLTPSKELQVAYHVNWKYSWEPFYIAAKGMPLYDERFKQYGFNRISQVCELHVSGYQFVVLNNAFLAHSGFKRREEFHASKNKELTKNKILFGKFKDELKVKYPNSTRTCL